MWSTSILLGRVIVVEISEDLVKLGLHFLDLSILIPIFLVVFVPIWRLLVQLILLPTVASAQIYQLPLLFLQSFFSALLLQELSHVLELSGFLWEIGAVLRLVCLESLLAIWHAGCRQSKANVLLQI